MDPFRRGREIVGRLAPGDRRALAALGLGLAVLTALTWRRWGNPAFDAGNELTVADLVAHGAVPYRDVRYYYGPLGLYALAADFRLLGTSLAAAWAFGYLQTIALIGAFYALARQWLVPLSALLATAVLLVIGFSGSIFDFVLPHTESGPLAEFALVLELLALVRGRLTLAGLAFGAVILIRPEFTVFSIALIGGAGLATAADAGLRPAAVLVARLTVPGLAVAIPVLVGFALVVGWHRLFLENLFPLDFVRAGGGKLDHDRAPFTLPTLIAMLARGALVGGLIAAATLAVAGVRERGRRLRGMAPLGVWLVAVVALDGLVRVTGINDAGRRAIDREAQRLLLAMSWLPALAVVASVAALWALRRRRPAPALGWPLDLALIAGAAACGLRSYNDFTTDVHVPYFAALPVLLAAVVLDRAHRRIPRARGLPLIALGAIGAALLVQGYFGRYRHYTYTLHSARGTYLAFNHDDAGAHLDATLRYIDSHTRPGQPILVLADDGGLHFLADRPPALYDLTYLPGNLAPLSAERRAVARLRATRPALVVIGARTFDAYGKHLFGVDYNRLLYAEVLRDYVPVATFGDFAHPPSVTGPSEAWRVYSLRG